MTVAYEGLATLQGAEILAPALHAAHKVWIREASSYLVPIMASEAAFWERWTAVRYLADQFLAQLERERALIDELRSFLPAEVVERLVRDAERIAQQQAQLDRIGRRRGTGHTVSVAARALVNSLRAWCAEIEATAGQVPREWLPESATRLIDDLGLYTQVHG